MPTIEQARAWYRHNDPVHGFDHILRVLALAEILSKEENADLEIVRAAALLHDASGGDAKKDERSSHHEKSADFAREILANEGWTEDRIREVTHCIAAHRYRGGDKAQSIEAKILFDADKLDVVGAFGVARTIAYAVEANQPIFAQVSQSFLDSGKKVEGEAHSAYHEYIFKLRHVKDSLQTKSAKNMAMNREKVLTAFFESLADEAQLSTLENVGQDE